MLSWLSWLPLPVLDGVSMFPVTVHLRQPSKLLAIILIPTKQSWFFPLPCQKQAHTLPIMQLNC